MTQFYFIVFTEGLHAGRRLKVRFIINRTIGNVLCFSFNLSEHPLTELALDSIEFCVKENLNE